MENKKPAITCIVLTEYEAAEIGYTLGEVIDDLYFSEEMPHSRISILQNVYSKLYTAKFTRNY